MSFTVNKTPGPIVTSLRALYRATRICEPIKTPVLIGLLRLFAVIGFGLMTVIE